MLICSYNDERVQVLVYKQHPHLESYIEDHNMA